MKSWYDELPPPLREIADEALGHAGFEGDEAPSQRLRPSSRQAQHARYQRARSTVLAAAAFLCGRDRRYENFLLAPPAAYLRPLSAQTHNKANHLTRLASPLPSDYFHLFDRASELVVDVYSTLDSGDQRHALLATNAFACMFLPCIVFGEPLAGRWKHAHARAERAGLLDYPYARMQLALMGSYVGHPEPHMDWLLDAEAIDTEMADVFIFVRRDVRPDLFAVQEALIRGEHVASSSCMLPTRPLSTLRHLGDYILACMRNPTHFRSPSLALMTLAWANQLRGMVASWSRGDPDGAELESVRERLRRFERVQLMEKGRFFSVLAQTNPGPWQQRLEQLWACDYSAA